MKNYRSYILMACWAICIAAQLLLPAPVFLIQTMIIILSLLTMMFLKTMFNFLIFLSIVLAYGFGLTVYSINYQIFNEGQYQLILAHLLLTSSLLLNWLIIHELKALYQKMQEMQARLHYLEKFDEQTKALSFQEFKERGLLIETAMRRRGEKGQLLYFRMNEHIPMSVKASLRQEFAKVCLHTIRTNFDLITSPTEEEVLILLQGTTPAGRDIVISRLEENVRKNLNFVSMPYSVHFFEVENLEKKLDELIGRKGA